MSRRRQRSRYLVELVDLYFERHARERLAHVTRPFGDVRLCELNRMAGDIVGCILDYPSVR